MAGIILTNAGKAALANAHLAGEQVVLTHMAVGDGGGKAVTPDEGQKALVNEVHRAAVDDLYTDPKNPNWVVVEMAIPANTGGWYVREVGVFDDKGKLFAVGAYPETFKPVLDQAVGKDLYIKFIMEISNTSDVTLSVDPTVAHASRDYVQRELHQHNTDAGAHPGLIAGLSAEIAIHNTNPDAHKPLFDTLNTTLNGLRKQVVIDKMMAGAADTGYAHGFIKDFSESADIVASESSGYVHDAAGGVFRSIDPALDSGDVVADWTQAKLEDVKGGITTLTVDTANRSGHFDQAINSRIVSGCTVTTSAGSVIIKAITGDGTTVDSVEIASSVGAGNYSVQGIHGLSVDGALKLSGYAYAGTKNAFTGGTASGVNCRPGYPASKAFDGGLVCPEGGGNSALLSKGYNLITIIYDFGEGKTKAMDSIGFQLPTGTGTLPGHHAPRNFTIQGSVDGSNWDVLVNKSGVTWSSQGQIQTWKPSNTKAYRYYKWDVTRSADLGNYIYIGECIGYERFAYVPEKVAYPAIADLPGNAWSAINSIVVSDAAHSGDVWYMLRFGDEYKIWTGNAFASRTRKSSGKWEYWTGSVWTAASQNTVYAAIAEALSVEGNRMASATVANLVDANFGGVYPDGIAVALHMPLAGGGIPEVTSTTFGVSTADMPMTLLVAPQDNASLPTTSPKSILAEFGIIPQVGIDPATDIKIEVSDDDGASYVAATLDQAVQFVTGQYLITGVGDVSGQSGTKPKIKITAAAGKRIKVDAGGGFWS